jgi:hypothetical protein
MSINNGRFTATLEGDYVVFLIGMRINNPLRIFQWLPVFLAMPRMLKELEAHPELGLIHSEMWLSRTIITVQYWRSVQQLLDYSRNKSDHHLPAWAAFNESVKKGGSAVGVWHETYCMTAGKYENVYVNMPAFGLGKAGKLQPATGTMVSARSRLGLPET